MGAGRLSSEQPARVRAWRGLLVFLSTGSVLPGNLACLALNLALCLSAGAVDRINITEPPYGAVPNDGISDTAAINAAIAAGSSIYFPPGKYNYTGKMTLPANKSFRLYGDGPGVSTIAFTGNPSAGINASNVGPNTLNVDGLTLSALTENAGNAIYGAFSEPLSPSNNQNKFRTAGIKNVQIMGTTRDGTTGGWWLRGIYLSRAQDAVIDDVEISGNTLKTIGGIAWVSPATIPTTGIFISNVQIKYCDYGVLTDGWVEGLYMSGFEVVLCGRNGRPVMDLKSTQSSPSPAFHLLNGHIDLIGDGVRMTNLSGVKISKVDFAHINPPVTTSGTHLHFYGCLGIQVTDCSFTGNSGSLKLPDENGVFLTNSRIARISGNTFGGLQPTNGSCIVVYSGSSGVRITDNLFNNVRQRYYDAAPDTYFWGNN